MLSVRFLPLAALLLAGFATSPALAAPSTTAPLVVAAVAGPYDNDYAQGYFSGETYVSCGCRSMQDVYDERSWAENQQQNAGTLHQYYYLQGYIDRLSEFLNSGY